MKKSSKKPSSKKTSSKKTAPKLTASEKRMARFDCMTMQQMTQMRVALKTALSKKAPQAKRTAAVKAVKKLVKNKVAACPV